MNIVAYLETPVVFELLAKYEESYLCMDEIFHAKVMILKFHNYIQKSRTDDLFNLMRTTLEEAEFISQRIPTEWKTTTEGKTERGKKKVWTPTWSRALKFLYQQATQTDFNFDYLQVLSLGLDKETRLPLNEDALYSLLQDD